jgi:nucleoside-diphosphate-sugar epimerase
MNDFKGQLLLTGATGFLGGAIAAELIAKPVWERTLLLVRAPDRATACGRLRNTLARFEVPDELLERVREEQIILGDFKRAAEIFEAPDQAARLSGVTRVINSAAVATFSNHPGLWPINVVGTFEFVRRLHEIARIERFVHVGTAMCHGMDIPSAVPEGYESPNPPQHLVPYTETKVFIENKIRTELPDLPFVVVRPTIIVGHSKLGTRPSGSIYWVFRTALLLGAFTCALTDSIDVVPVDWTAQAIVHIALKDSLSHNLYHASAGPDHASTFAELDIATARGRGVAPLGERYRQASYEELAGMRDQYQEKLGSSVNPRIMQRAIRLYGEFAALNVTFRNDRLLAEGMSPPPPFAAYAHLCAATSESSDIAEQMTADYK